MKIEMNFNFCVTYVNNGDKRDQGFTWDTEFLSMETAVNAAVEACRDMYGEHLHRNMPIGHYVVSMYFPDFDEVQDVCALHISKDGKTVKVCGITH